MDVIFREFEPYYSDTTTPFDDSSHVGATSSRSNESQVTVGSVPCPIFVGESDDEIEDNNETKEINNEHQITMESVSCLEIGEESDDEMESGIQEKEDQTQGELKVYRMRKRYVENLQNDGLVPLLEDHVEINGRTSQSTTSKELALRRSSYSTAGKPPIRYGYEYDIAQFVSYSNISPKIWTFITSLDAVPLPNCWQEAKNDQK